MQEPMRVSGREAGTDFGKIHRTVRRRSQWCKVKGPRLNKGPWIWENKDGVPWHGLCWAEGNQAVHGGPRLSRHSCLPTRLGYEALLRERSS